MPSIVEVKDDFSPGFYKALACVVIEFGRLEYFLKLCVKDLSGKRFDEGMLQAESINGFGRLCGVAAKQARDKLEPGEVAPFVKILDKARKLAIYRHDSIHAMWLGEVDAPLRIRPRIVNEAVDWTRGGVVPVDEVLTS